VADSFSATAMAWWRRGGAAAARRAGGDATGDPMAGNRTTKVDFHLHSYASNVTDYYAANTFAIPESYSDPIATYHE